MYRSRRALWWVRALYSCVLLSLATGASAAQGRVSGVLFDSLLTGRPVAGALVSIEGTDFRVRTDSRGRFDFRDVPAGSQTLGPIRFSVCEAILTLRRGDGQSERVPRV